MKFKICFWKLADKSRWIIFWVEISSRYLNFKWNLFVIPAFYLLFHKRHENDEKNRVKRKNPDGLITWFGTNLRHFKTSPIHQFSKWIQNSCFLWNSIDSNAKKLRKLLLAYQRRCWKCQTWLDPSFNICWIITFYYPATFMTDFPTIMPKHMIVCNCLKYSNAIFFPHLV